MPRSILVLLAALVQFPGLVSGATNLVPNPRFDADIGGWVPGFGAEILGWHATDELAKPASGSLRMTNLESQTWNEAWSGCFAVSAGSTIVFGTSVYSPTAISSTAAVKLILYAGPNCEDGVKNLYSDPATNARLGGSTWVPAQGNGVVPAGAQSAILVVRSQSAGTAPAEQFFDNAYVYEGDSCAATPAIACMNDRRFRVAMSWEIPDGTRGYGSLVPFSGDSLRATFFNPGNVEIVLKVLDGCAVNQRYWVFAAGLTNVEVKVQVTDTQTGEVWEHENPLDQPFAPVQDTSAFDVCPH